MCVSVRVCECVCECLCVSVCVCVWPLCTDTEDHACYPPLIYAI